MSDETDYGGWPSALWRLRLFGERGYVWIQVNLVPDEYFEEQAITNWRLTEEQQQSIRRVHRLFPEAETISGGANQHRKHDLRVLVWTFDESLYSDRGAIQ